ncbi:MAG: putative N-acyltransferase [Oleiphilaceae bacterium]|jgi:predicted N-acyltransferase
MQFEINHSISSIPEADWESLNTNDFPFIRHAFLSALESSRAVSEKTGWQAHHLIVKDKDKVIAVVPSYLKLHSYGEYVFDFQWAEAYQRTGIEYYPKLISAIPFSPVTGPRLLLHSDYNESEILDFISNELRTVLSESNYSSWHSLFLTKQQSDLFASKLLSQRRAVHFKWINKPYTSFEDFLDTCSSRHRKNMRKERRKVTEQGIQLRQIEGLDVTEKEWQHFYQFYQATYLKRSGHGGYLSADFFILLKQTMANQLMLVTATKDQEMIGAALYLKDDTSLYGRYWGSYSEDEFLHFEACYYQGIEYCIKHGLKYFDPGVQGEHKLQRGFEPYFTYSNHWIVHPEFRLAINQFLKDEPPYIEEYFSYTQTRLPYKKA